MILEFSKDSLINMDAVSVVRWVENGGIIVVDGQKIVIKDEAEFNLVKSAFIGLHKSYIYGDDLKKIRYIKFEEGE